MTLVIELTPEQELRLDAAAKSAGLEAAALAQQLVAEHLPVVAPPSVPDARSQALIDLLRSWREEDATDDPQELERRDSENQTLMMNLQANRLTLRLPEA